MRIRERIPGCIFTNHGRFWWRVRLPGERAKKARPLIPVGGHYATNDPNLAKAIAKDTFRRAVMSVENGAAPSDGRLASVITAYLAFAERYYRGSREVERIRLGLNELAADYGTLMAEEFGPLMLKQVRTELIQRGLVRVTINQRINVIKRVFKWAASEELIPGTTYHALTTVEGLRRGRSEAKDNPPVKPVAEIWVRMTMQHLPPTVAAMVELQMLTGMRSGEVAQMRPCDIDMRGPIWLYRPATHKTAIHGHKRVVPIGPRGQAILRPFLTRDFNAVCFAPVEAQGQRNAEKRRHRKSKVQPSQIDRSRPDARPLGDRYDAHAYRRAIDYAIRVANKAILAEAAKENRGVKETDLVPAWHPHQLRHTAATIIRREMGLDAARALLGHKSLGITDTYAELDQALAVEAARRLG